MEEEEEMDNNKKDQNIDPENIEQTAADPNQSPTEFNAGGNDSDYDGGHPKDVFPESRGRIESPEEQQNQDQENPDESNSESFNSGGNDSDYDGGHPKDVFPESKGRIDSDSDNSSGK